MARRHNERKLERAQRRFELIENGLKRVQSKLKEIGGWPQCFGPEQIAAGKNHGHDLGGRTIYRGARHRAKIDERLLAFPPAAPEHPFNVLGKKIELDVDCVAGLGVLDRKSV